MKIIGKRYILVTIENLIYKFKLYTTSVFDIKKKIKYKDLFIFCLTLVQRLVDKKYYKDFFYS